MNGHECYIIGAGDFFGLREAPDDSDYVIAADAGFEYCTENCIIPDLVLGDFDSLGKAPKHPNVLQLPVEKDDTDTILFLLSHGARGWLFGENYVWTAIKNSSLRIEGKGDVAVFCFDGKAEGVSIKGLKYELDDAEISSDFPLGVSNSFASREAEISVKNGALLIMYDIKVNEID